MSPSVARFVTPCNSFLLCRNTPSKQNTHDSASLPPGAEFKLEL